MYLALVKLQDGRTIAIIQRTYNKMVDALTATKKLFGEPESITWRRVRGRPPCTIDDAERVLQEVI